MRHAVARLLFLLLALSPRVTVPLNCGGPDGPMGALGNSTPPISLAAGEVPYSPIRIHAVPDPAIRTLLFNFHHRQEQEARRYKGENHGDAPELRRLPEGIPTAYRPAFQRIFDLFKDRERDELFLHAQKLEFEIYYRSLVEKVPFETMYETVLNEREARHGFKKVVTLENGVYSGEEFMQMLAQGALFLDPTFHDAGRKGIGGAAHGSTTHRVLQWHGIMRDMEIHPELYGNVRAVDLFTYMGNPQLEAQLDFVGTGVYGAGRETNRLWVSLFDQASLIDKVGPSPFSPEGVRGMHARLPLMGPLLH